MRRLFRSRVIATTTLAAGAALAAACNDSTSPPPATPNRQIGALQLEVATTAGAEGRGSPDSAVSSGPIKWDPPRGGAGVVTAPKVIEVADTVRAGEPLRVIVRTVLPDGCWRTDGEDVRQSGLLLEVTPQDARSDAQACTMIYAFGEHRVTARFDTPGTATIRVKGRRLRQGGQASTEPVTAERTVVVR